MNRRILVINPNTSAAVTDAVVRHCRLAQPALDWQGVTSRLGAPYISNEIASAIAAHAVLETYAEHFDGHAAVLIACFGDPGLLALRELAAAPVVGLAQASFEAAGARGRFAVVTGGAAWGPMLHRFARLHQLDTHLMGVHTVDLTGAQIAEAPERALDALLAAAMRGIDDGAQTIVLGGAALGGLAAQLQPRLPVPILDNIALAAQAVVSLVEEPGAERVLATPLGAMAGVGPALASLFAGTTA